MKRQNFYGSFSELQFFDRFGSETRRAPAPACSLNRPPRISRTTILFTSPRQQTPDGFLDSHAQSSVTSKVSTVGSATPAVQPH